MKFKYWVILGIVSLALVITFIIATSNEYESKIGSKGKELSQKKEKDVENTVNPPGSTQEAIKIANSVLYTFFDHVNSKEYQKAFNMLDSEYVKDIAYELDTFKEIYKYNGKLTFMIKQINIVGNRIVTSIDIYENNNKLSMGKFTILPSERGYYLMNEGVFNVSEVAKSKEEEGVKYQIKSKYALNDGVGYVLKIHNGSNEIVELANSNKFMGEANKEKYIATEGAYGTFDSNVLQDNTNTYFIKFKDVENVDKLIIFTTNNKTIEILL